MPRGRVAEFDPEMIRDISVDVYKQSLGERGTKDMVATDKDGGKRLRSTCAIAYDPLTRKYVRAVLRAIKAGKLNVAADTEEGDDDGEA